MGFAHLHANIAPETVLLFALAMGDSPYFSGKTLDDVMRSIVEALHAHGVSIQPSKGPATELSGVLLEIKNPRARLSRTETRGKLFTALGELCWYLAKTNAADFIECYIPPYSESAEDNVIFGGYGPRLFSWKGLNQVENVVGLLRKKPYSRQAVIQLFDATDIAVEHKDVPCTCTLQLMNRQGKLHMVVNMRSNDVYWGLPHDVFCFTMLQEIVARTLSVDMGTYKHTVGSLHLYKRHEAAARRFLKEGWQSTALAMPSMPVGDPWAAIAVLTRAEEAIRIQGTPDAEVSSLDPYWADLVRLLQIFRSRKDRHPNQVKALREQMSSGAYYPFIDRVIRKLEAVKPVKFGD